MITFMERQQMNTRGCLATYAPCVPVLIPLIVLGLLLAGCGVKGLPKPISTEAPPQIQDLAVKVRAGGVELKWSVPAQLQSDLKDAGYSYSILRSELDWENRSCPECPAPSRQEVLRIDAAHPEPARLQGQVITWIDPDVSANHAYRYQVSLLDRKNRPLNLSNPAIAKVLPPPPAPKGLAAVTQPAGILLRWKELKKDDHGRPFQGELQFVIEKRLPNEPWEEVSTIPANGNSFLDPAVASSKTYDYRVFPVLIFEQTPIYGEPATIREAKAPAALPPPPPNTVWAIPAKGGLAIHWIESQGKVSGYYVYRRQGKEIIRLTANPVQHPPFMDRSVKPNAVYFYAVSSVSPQPDEKEGLLSKWAEIKSFLLDKE